MCLRSRLDDGIIPANVQAKEKLADTFLSIGQDLKWKPGLSKQIELMQPISKPSLIGLDDR